MMETPLDLPDPLVMLDGTPVTRADQWPERRREILNLFEENMYGRMPENNGGLSAERIESSAIEIDGVWAMRTQTAIRFAAGGDDGPVIQMLQYLPLSGAPCGVAVSLNFGGNHTVTTDPGVLLRSGDDRIERLCGIERKHPTDADRGSAISRWPIGLILRGGFGVATAYSGDIEPDHPNGRPAGVRAMFDDPSLTWACIAAWAWGLRRMLDVLQRDPSIDPDRIAVVGHSRLGKAALWAAAMDERFAMAVSNDSGCCGAALKRRKLGERYRDINERFPYWFTPKLLAFNDREETCPVDQHLLLAAIAPRPLYVASATEDAWADPLGEFLAAYHAGPVYRLLGRVPLESAEPPVPNLSVGKHIGYHARTGKHDITEADWQQYVTFAARQISVH